MSAQERLDAIWYLRNTDVIACQNYLHSEGQQCECETQFVRALNALGVSGAEYAYTIVLKGGKK